MSLDKLNHTDRLVEHGRPFEVAVDYERTDLVLGALLDLYRQGEYPYNLESTQVPHARSNMSEYLPRDGAEHASFLWATPGLRLAAYFILALDIVCLVNSTTL